MTNELAEIRDHFLAALEQDGLEAQLQYAAEHCSDTPVVRAKLEDMLRAHHQPEGFLASRGDCTPTIDLPITERPGDTIGPYTLIEQIGEGGFGVVYMAEQEQPVRRRVALKIIKPGMDTRDVVSRFEAERQALAMMDHPHIAKVFDAGTTETGRPYFAMELVKGIAITEYCDQSNLPTRERLALFIRVCQAMQHAHQKGIIHRDLKPTNVLVALQDGQLAPKIIDFGVAKAVGIRLTEHTFVTSFAQMVGTPMYMSPEQAEMSPLEVDTRTDVYSLGVLLYELLTSTTPYEKDRLKQASFDELRRIIREEEPPSPSARLSTLDAADRTTLAERRRTEPRKLGRLVRGELDWIVMKCLEKDRHRRYASAKELADDVDRYLHDEAIEARPPSTWYQLQKFARRHKTVMTAVASVVAILLAATVISTYSAVRAMRAERLATERLAQTEQERNEKDQARIRADRHLYAANMNLVQRVWPQHNVRAIRQLLDETASSDDRGFEWYYWQRELHRQQMTLYGHARIVYDVAYSHDGRRLVTGGQNAAIVWNARTGEQLGSLTGHGPNAAVTSVSFTPDGSRIVTGSFDQTARIWDADSFTQLHVLAGHDAVVMSVDVSIDGRWIVTASEDYAAILWDAQSGRLLRTFREHTDRVKSAKFSPDGLQVVTGSWDKTVIVWDAETGAVKRRLPVERTRVESVAWSPDGKWIAAGCEDGTINIWAVRGGRDNWPVRSLQPRNFDRVVTISFSPDSRRLISGSYDTSAAVWDVATGDRQWSLHGHSNIVYGAVFSPDGKQIATGSEDRTIRVWPAAPPDNPMVFHQHRSPVESVVVSPDGSWCVSGTREGTFKVWDLDGGQIRFENVQHRDRVNCIAVSPSGDRIVTGSWDRTAIVWDAATGQKLTTLEGHTDRVWSAAFSLDGSQIVTGSENGTVRIWNAASGHQMQQFDVGYGRVYAVAFSPDGQQVAIGCNGAAAIWNVSSPKLVRRLEQRTVLCVAFDQDGKYLLTGGADGTARLWESNTGRAILSLTGHVGGPRWGITSVRFSPDGTRVLTSGWDGSVTIWDRATGKQLLALDGNRGSIHSADISRDGRLIVAGADDGYVLSWRCASPQDVRRWAEEDRAGQAIIDKRDHELGDWYFSVDSGGLDSPVAINAWLVAGPVFDVSDVATWLENDSVSIDFNDLPREGDPIEIGGRELLWRPIRLSNLSLDFMYTVGAGEPSHFSAAYAVSYLWSDRPRTDLILKVGSDDQARLTINGQEVYRRELPRPMLLEDSTRGVTLNAGLNVIVFQVRNETDYWSGSVRFTDTAGQPVQGIVVTLDPDFVGMLSDEQYR